MAKKKEPKVEINEKGKNSGIVFLIMIVILIVLAALLVITKKNNEDKKCERVLGGSFTIKYVTNGGSEIPDSSVCVACSPDSYSKLAIPTKEGYKFTGWYYDKDLSSKAGDSTADIYPQVNVVDGCIQGYKVVTLYAGWE